MTTRPERPTDIPSSTVQEVAKAAGVSIATVSRFLNGTARVSEKRRASIEQAVSQLNYKPNLLAQGLKKGKSKTIGILAQSLSQYFSEALVGVEAALAGTGYASLIVTGHWRADEEAERIELLLARRIDGLIVLTGNLSENQLRGFASRVPVIATGRHIREKNFAGVKFDNVQGAKDATEYLVGLGHRRIAFITGPFEHRDAADRLAGYKAALEARGIQFDPDLVVPGDFHESGGMLAVNQLLESGRRFTAIFASNDQLAYGARLGLYRRGIRVPDDMSVVGFDDLPGSLYTTPPLTTVRQPMFEIGKCIGEALLKMIHGEDANLDVPQLTLIIRESARRLS